MKYYTGIGSRYTPHDIMLKMIAIAQRLEYEGYVLRSGGADGADTAFEKGVCSLTNKEIYLPWKGFNNNNSPFTQPTPESIELSSQHHPYWDRLKDSVKRLMGRNAHQVLGLDLKIPSHFILCWTKDGCESDATRTAATGGTGQAISIASFNNIPVINMKNENWETRLEELLTLIKENVVENL